MEQPERMYGDGALRNLPTADRAQRVCDFIAGMTDRYAVYCFDRQFIPKSMRTQQMQWP
jgi:dGTP triphosphohydrolase